MSNSRDPIFPERGDDCVRGRGGKGRSKPEFKFIIRISETPMTQAEFEAAEDLLARMIARAIAAEQGWLKTDDNQTKGDDSDARELDTGRED
jgi:hypothetical protein